jgi:hypothetical protein
VRECGTHVAKAQICSWWTDSGAYGSYSNARKQTVPLHHELMSDAMISVMGCWVKRYCAE